MKEAKSAVLKLTADYEEAQAVKRGLPDRLKNTVRLIHSLQRQKQEAVNKLDGACDIPTTGGEVF